MSEHPPSYTIPTSEAETARHELVRQEAEITLILSRHSPIHIHSLNWQTSKRDVNKSGLALCSLQAETDEGVTKKLILVTSASMLRAEDPRSIAVLAFTANEWQAFAEGVQDGEFDLSEIWETNTAYPPTEPPRAMPPRYYCNVDADGILTPRAN